MRVNTRYVNETLHINGTAESLFREVKEGYRSNPEEIDRIADICISEGMLEEFEFCVSKLEELGIHKEEDRL